jgi:hypothetical protein
LDPSSCAILGISTPDNDIRLDRDRRTAGKPVKVPEVVADKIYRLAATMLAGDSAALSDGFTCEELFSPVYRISGLGRLELFVAQVSVPRGPAWFFLILDDPLTGATTEVPPRIGSKWPMLFGAQDELVRLPLVTTVDLFGDDRREVVFEERVHNGTIYNGTVYHYFAMGPDLKLTPLLARETRVLDPTNDSRLYIREITPLGARRLTLDLYEVAAQWPARRKPLGSAFLERPPGGGPFRVVERHPLGDTHTKELVTLCDSAASDDAFLRDGCDFYY